ncbi:MAG: hypothetical protein WCO60_15250 [Verrucomicrobiota bacterium]
MKDDQDLSRTCKIDLRELTQSIRELDNASVTAPVTAPPPSPYPKSLVDLFGEEVRSLRFKNAKVSEIVISLLEKLNLPDSHAHLILAGKRIGEIVDNSTIDQPSYHNQYHVAEVVMAAFILGKRERLSNIQIAEIVVAAAGHDLGHPGKNNTSPFEIESLSCDLGLPILKAFQWAESELERFRQMLLATDFVNGVPKARVAYLTSRGLPPDHEERALAAQCLILTEADILFSCFNTEYNEELSKLLSREWNLPTDNLTLKQRLGFLNSVIFLSDAAKQLGLDNRRQALVKELEAALLQS